MEQSQGGQAVREPKLIINPQWEHAQFVSIAELNECQQKLDAANARVKQLEIIINRASTAYFADGTYVQVAARMAQILDESKESKP